MERHININGYWSESALDATILHPYLNKRLFVGVANEKYGAFIIRQAKTDQLTVMVTRIYCPLKYRSIAIYFCQKYNYLMETFKLLNTIAPNTNQAKNLLDALLRNIWFHKEIMLEWFRQIEKEFYNDALATGKTPKGNMSNHHCLEIESWIRQEYFIGTHHPAKVMARHGLIKMNTDVFAMGTQYISFQCHPFTSQMNTLLLLTPIELSHLWANDDFPSDKTMKQTKAEWANLLGLPTKDMLVS